MRNLLSMTAMALAMTLSSSANAATILYEATLDGVSEVPANASPGFGSATAKYDNVANRLKIDISFGGLVGGATLSANIQAATAAAGAGVAGDATAFAGFPIGVAAGFYVKTLDLAAAATYNPAFIAANGNTAGGAKAALVAALAAGKAYINIRTNAFPGGEIRGFFVVPPPPVPEPASWALMIGGFALTGAALRRRMGATVLV